MKCIVETLRSNKISQALGAIKVLKKYLILCTDLRSMHKYLRNLRYSETVIKILPFYSNKKASTSMEKQCT